MDSKGSMDYTYRLYCMYYETRIEELLNAVKQLANCLGVDIGDIKENPKINHLEDLIVWLVDLRAKINKNKLCVYSRTNDYRFSLLDWFIYLYYILYDNKADENVVSSSHVINELNKVMSQFDNNFKFYNVDIKENQYEYNSIEDCHVGLVEWLEYIYDTVKNNKTDDNVIKLKDYIKSYMIDNGIAKKKHLNKSQKNIPRL